MADKSDIIYFGCDDAGYELKLTLIKHLEKLGYKCKDCGCKPQPSRYPYYAARVAKAISTGEAKRGVLICGTGVGISIAANKFRGIRASLCTNSYLAKMTRAHNDSNILCMGAYTTGPQMAIEILETWLDTEYEQAHHVPSIDLISQIEAAAAEGKIWEYEGDEPAFKWPAAE